MMKSILVWLLATAILISAPATHAQQSGKIFRIGYLDPSTASGSKVPVEAFRQELSKLGWIEGKNITIEYRFGEQKPNRLPDLAAELVRQKVDLIVVTSVPSASAAKSSTTTILIVMAAGSDPVAAGLIDSLARPGGNVTGLSGLASELNTKRLEILRDVVPKLVQVGLLRQLARSRGRDLQLNELRAAALALKLKLEEIDTQPDAKGLGSPLKPLSKNKWARL